MKKSEKGQRLKMTRASELLLKLARMGLNNKEIKEAINLGILKKVDKK